MRYLKTHLAGLVAAGLSTLLANGAVAQDKIELTFMSWEASPLESASIQAGLEGFKKTHPNVTVKYVTAPFAQHHAKLRTMMAAGTAPDVFYLNPDYQRDFIENGQLLDLSELFPKYWDINDFIPSSREKIQVEADGQKRIYGVDVCTVGPVLYYNKKLFDEAKVPYPPTKREEQWSWDEFVGHTPKMSGEFYPMESCNIDAVWSGTAHPKEAVELVTFLTSMEFATPIYKSGLWMPNRLSMYEPEKLKTWYDPSLDPEGWIDMKHLWTEGHLRWFDKIKKTDEIYTITSDALQSYFYSDRPLDEVLPELQQRVNDVLQQ